MTEAQSIIDETRMLNGEAAMRLEDLAPGQRGGPAGSTVRVLAANLIGKALGVVPTLCTSFFLFAIVAAQAVLLARTLEPQGRGEYATVILYTRVLTYIGLFGVNYAIVRRAALANGELRQLSRSAQRVGLLTGLSTMAVVIMLSLVALPHGKEHLALLCIACATTLPLEQIRLNLNAVDQGSGNLMRFNAGRLLAAAAMPMLLAAAWFCGGVTVATATYLLIPATLIGLIFRLVWSDDYRPWRAASPNTATLLREGQPFALSQTVSDLFNQLDTVLIMYLASSVQQGLYVAALPAVRMLCVAPEAFAVFAFNAGVKREERHTARNALSACAGMLLFQAFSALVYSLIVGQLISLVYGDKFQGAIALAFVLMPGLAFQGCTIVADGYLRGRGKATAGVRARLVAALVMCLAAILFHQYGIELAVPLAASIANGIGALWIGSMVLRDVRQAACDDNLVPVEQQGAVA